MTVSDSRYAVCDSKQQALCSDQQQGVSSISKGRSQNRSSRAKPKQSKSNRSRLHFELRKLSFTSAWTLVTAAGASPMCAHRWASVAHVTARILSDLPDGRSPATLSGFGRMMRAVPEETDWPAFSEDYIPADTRLDVRVRWGDAIYRILPGQIERPVADIERARLLSRVLDERILAQRGFGIGDFVTVALRWMHYASDVLSPVWPDGERPGLIDEPRLSLGELTAAAQLMEPPPFQTETPSEKRALNWATDAAESVRYRPMDPQSTFGKTLAIWRPEIRRGKDSAASDESKDRLYLPPAFIPEVLSFGIGNLAAGVTNSATIRDYTAAVADQTRRALWRFGPVTGVDDHLGSPVVSPNNTVQFVMEMGDSRALLVQVFAGLNLTDREWPEEFMAKLVADEGLRQTNGGKLLDIPMSAGVLTISSTVELTALVVLAASGHIAAPQRPGQATLSLEDLQWISRTADSDVDLYMFCRDLSRLAARPGPGLSVSFGWEGINYWEWWRSNGKSFFSGGANPMLFIAPHWGEQEWKDCAQMSLLEENLLNLGLPARGEHDVIERRGGPDGVYRWNLRDSGSGQSGDYHERNGRS